VDAGWGVDLLHRFLDAGVLQEIRAA
jgi:hypothetical protein